MLDSTSGNSGKKKGKPDDQIIQLHAQIGALESLIAKKAHAQIAKVQMRRENILPPPDQTIRRRKKGKVLSHAQRRRYHLQRSLNGLHFLFLFCLACAIGWWLIFSGV